MKNTNFGVRVKIVLLYIIGFCGIIAVQYFVPMMNVEKIYKAVVGGLLSGICLAPAIFYGKKVGIFF